MDGSHPVKLFRHGPNQAVDIPAELELPGDEAVIRREGTKLIIESQPRMTTGAELWAFLQTLEPLEDAIGNIEDFPPRPVRI